MTRSRRWYTMTSSYAVGDAEALIPVSARTCYAIDESGLPKRHACEGATQAGKSVKGTNYLVNILKMSLYLDILPQKKWKKYWSLC